MADQYYKRKRDNDQILDRLTADYDSADGPCWADITAGFDHPHYGIAKVVVKIADYDKPYEPGVELVKRITKIPEMVAALRSVLQAESLYDAQAQAREVLQALGLNDVYART
jgi:hypothetical protein